MNFYRFGQNSSGGYYVGPHVIFIQAASAEEANAIAPEYGIYFGGVSAGRDCECCGDRWGRAWSEIDCYSEEEVEEEVSQADGRDIEVVRR